MQAEALDGCRRISKATGRPQHQAIPFGLARPEIVDKPFINAPFMVQRAIHINSNYFRRRIALAHLAVLSASASATSNWRCHSRATTAFALPAKSKRERYCAGFCGNTTSGINAPLTTL